jgi:hypothetical protein
MNSRSQSSLAQIISSLMTITAGSPSFDVCTGFLSSRPTGSPGRSQVTQLGGNRSYLEVLRAVMLGAEYLPDTQALVLRHAVLFVALPQPGRAIVIPTPQIDGRQTAGSRARRAWPNGEVYSFRGIPLLPGLFTFFLEILARFIVRHLSSNPGRSAIARGGSQLISSPDRPRLLGLWGSSNQP